MDFNFQTIGEYCELITSGGTPNRKIKEYYGGMVDWFKTQELLDSNLYHSEEKITALGLKFSSAKLLPVNTVSMAMYGATVGKLGILKNGGATNQAFCNMIVKKENDYRFLYYWLMNEREKLISLASGAAQQNLNLKTISNYKIPKIGNVKQQSIANILSSLDDKIELNNKINKNLEEIAQTLYKRWFVDFEFPNENGEPYKSSGGEMVDSELGMIPKGWEVKKQGSYFPVVTGKKNANVATPNGKYKFFTCSQQVYKTDDFSFEGDAILIAGNGDFNVKYYSGKFEAYQRTYVLIPHNSKLSGLLFTAIKFNLSNITTGFRGSVINFITKGHIDNYLVVFPEDDKLELLAGIFKNALETIALNNVENERLTQIRDELLPKLMSGEIEVPIEE